MSEVWRAFERDCSNDIAWLKAQKFLTGDPPPDVEKLLDSLEVAQIEWTRTSHVELEHLRRVRAGLSRKIVEASVLKPDWWKDASLVGLFPTELEAHTELLRKLCAARQPGQGAPWIFTTNYDLAVEWASESLGLQVSNGFAGLHHRLFSPHNFDLGLRNTLARGEARFGTYNIYLAKLHGSLTWREAADGTVIEESTPALWPRLEKWLAGDGAAFLRLLVLPNAAKYLQTTAFVLGELLRRFTELLARPQIGLVVCGYSFSDDHLNRVLRAALQNPTLQLVLYIRKASRKGDVLDIAGSSRWVQRIAAMGLPQVTVVGGGDDASFSALAHGLPDPAIFDRQALEIRHVLREIEADGRGRAKTSEPEEPL
jgi:hypothetical protein